MPVTRSSTRSNSKATSPIARPVNGKRRKTSDETSRNGVTDVTDSSLSALASSSTTQVSSNSQDGSRLLPAVLTFSFEDAKQHLIGVDHRFEDLFNRMECKPFQHLEQVHPFR